VRATSPSGSAAYEGRVAWSAELGFGIRPPEPAQADDKPATPAEVVGKRSRPPEGRDGA